MSILLGGRAAAVTVLFGALVVPAAQAAPVIAVDKPCYGDRTDSEYVVTGTGFTPNAQIPLTRSGPPGTADASSAFTDAAGSFSTPFATPFLSERIAATLTLTATDPALGAAVTQFQAVHQSVRYSQTRVRSMRQYVTVSIGGLRPDARVYAHYLRAGRLRGASTLGIASGPCGVISKRVRLVPLATAPLGNWLIQYDSSKRYNKYFKPAYRIVWRTFAF